MPRVRKTKLTDVQLDAVKNEINDELKETNTEKIPAEEEQTGPETIKGTGIIVNSLFVKVRREPSTDADTVEVLRKGDKVASIGKAEEFYKVRTSTNRNAYILSEFVKEE